MNFKSSLVKNIRLFLKVLMILFLVFCTTVAGAQVIVPFNPRASYHTPNRTIYNIRGDFALLGNKNLSLATYSDGGSNSNNMVYVDVDNIHSTVNSSSASLQFSLENGADPDCSKIIYAGLYWTGRAHTGASPNTFSVVNPATGSTVGLNKGVVKLKHADATNYTTITASHSNHSTNIYYPSGAGGNMYSAYAEVTDYVREFGLGEYFVADIALNQGNGGTTGFYGGWGMIVVYENPAMNWRDVTIFDGHAYVASGGGANQLPISGFRTVQDGPVNLKLGLIAGEGDLGVIGDYFQIRNANNTQWVTLTHSGNLTNNFFNSSILTGGNPRNPNLLNNLGMDIAMFNILNDNNLVIANNQTSTTFRYGTASDTYIIFMIAMAVDAYIPDTEAFHRVEKIDGIAVTPGVDLEVSPGQIIEFSLEIRNKEEEDIENFAVTIPIPFATTYVSSTGEFFQGIAGGAPIHDPTAGPTGSIIWNTGTLPKQSNTTNLLAKLTYSLKVTEDCFILSNQSCNLEVIVAGSTSGQGVTTGISFDNIPLIQGYIDDGSNCQGFPITDPISLEIFRDDFIDAYCQPLQNYITRNFEFCNLPGTSIPFARVSANFPAGTRFFNTINLDTGQPTTGATEYNINTGFPIIQGNQSYFAIPPGNTNCYWQFTISVGNLTVSGPAGNLTVCFGQPVSITHQTTGATGLGPTPTLPGGVSANYSNNRVTLTGTPIDYGSLSYSIPLQGQCLGFAAEGVIVVQSAVTAGSIGSDQTIGYNTAPQQLVSTDPGHGSSETISYIWEKSTVSETNGFAPISGANQETYAPGNLTETTWFRRTTVSTLNGVNCYSAPTNTVQISVIDMVTPGQIGEDQTICSGQTPQTITSKVDGTGGGTISYRWELSTESYSSGFSEIDGETTLELTLSAPLYQTTWIRRITLSDIGGIISESPSSNVVQITVQVVMEGSIQDDQTICNGGTPAPIYGAIPDGTSGAIEYVWQSSVLSVLDGFTTIDGAIQKDFQPGSLTQTTWVRRITASTLNTVVCYSNPTNVVEITVQSPVSAEQIEPDQAICFGETPSPILSPADATGSGTISYIWQSSVLSALDGFATIDGAIQKDFQPGSLTQTTWYRRIATSTLNGVSCQSQPSNTVEINVANEIQFSASVSNLITCRDDHNGEITIIATGGDGTLQYSLNDQDFYTQNVFGNLPPGPQAYFVRDQRGCKVNSSMSLENPPLLVLQATQTAMVRCKGENNAAIELQGQGGWGTYNYSNDGSSFNPSPVFENLGANTYTFRVSDAQGCIARETIQITEPVEELGVEIINKRDALCFGQANGQATAMGLNGWGNYSYFWNTQPPQTTQTATGLNQGMYQVQVQDLHGCTALLELQISQPQPVLIVNIEISDVNCRRVDQGGAIFFDVVGGAGSPFYFSWNNGQTSGFLEGIPQGNYSVIVTDGNGCRAEESFVVLFLEEDCIVRIPQGFSPNGDGVNDVWEIRNLLYMHPDNRVKVFNRQGTLVFEAEKYDDDWNGTPNRGNVLVGQNGKVPTGVYFYMIWFQQGAVPVSGYLVISH